MVSITVLGGTGYAGSNIVKAGVQRGHNVVAYSRKAPADPVAGAQYRTGDVSGRGVAEEAMSGADVVISALSPRAELAEPGAMRALVAQLAEVAGAGGVRLGVIGGAGSLLVAEGGPKLADTDSFPVEFRAEASEMDGVLQDLRVSQPALDWFFVSPAAAFGAWAEGEPTGTFRLGRDLLLSDESGRSFISGADFGLAVVQEVERPEYRRQRFTVAY